MSPILPSPFSHPSPSLPVNPLSSPYFRLPSPFSVRLIPFCCSVKISIRIRILLLFLNIIRNGFFKLLIIRFSHQKNSIERQNLIKVTFFNVFFRFTVHRGLGFYTLSIQYYSVICHPSDHTVGRPMAENRTWDL